jgi:hypothetical protein
MLEAKVCSEMMDIMSRTPFSECGSSLPLSPPRACSREFRSGTLPVSLFEGISFASAIQRKHPRGNFDRERISRQQAGCAQSGSKLPHSKASLNVMPL